LARTVKVTLAFETPGFDKWLKEVAAMPAEQQIEVVVKKLQELNPKFDGKFSGVGDVFIKEGVVAGFSFCTNFVTDISPIRAFTHLKQLDCLGAVFDGQNGQLSDLAPLKGMELLGLNFSMNQVTDITPLMGMPLRHLSCYYNPMSNLSPLRNMQLEHFHLEGTKVADLSPLRGMTKLRGIWLGRTKVKDLSVLTGMPLGALWIFETQVTDLTPLRGMSLSTLSIQSSQVTDLSVLKDMPLIDLQLDFTPERDTELLRSIKTLNTINSKPAADFWKEVQKAAAENIQKKVEEEKAKEVQKASAKSLQKKVEEVEDLGKGIKLDLVLIPAGKFTMGSHATEKGREGNETQHEVTLTKSYYMGKYEVTQEQWEAVMGSNPSAIIKGANLPVTNVSWEDCQEFIKKLNAKTNGGYRFPTEAEWEYACKAGTTTAYSFGDKITPKDANYGDSKLGATVVVGSYKPNAFGLYDMYGNVWELCEDWYGDYQAGAVTDPKGPLTGEKRVLRGGSFDVNDSTARSSLRYYISPTLRVSPGDGFRLARTP